MEDNDNKTSRSLGILQRHARELGKSKAPTSVNWNTTLALLKCEKELAEVPISSSFSFNGTESNADVIVKYNEFYRNRVINKGETQSLSSAGSTPSETRRIRLCRIGMARRFFVSACFMCWVMNLVFLFLYLYLYYVLPMGFAREFVEGARRPEEVDQVIETDGGTNKTIYKRWTFAGKYTVLLSSFNNYIAGTWGIVAAYCGRKRVLKSFILRGPWLSTISIIYGYSAVQFAGALEQAKLDSIFQRHLGTYYTNNQSRQNWDNTQLWLKCCGIQGKEDWFINSVGQTEKFPRTCCRTSDNKPERDKEKLKLCTEDVTGKLVWKRGCASDLVDLYIKVSAALGAIQFFSTIFILLSARLGHRYYVIEKNLAKTHFYYSLKDYLIDFFCMRRIYRKYRARQLTKVVPVIPQIDSTDHLLSDKTSTAPSAIPSRTTTETEVASTRAKQKPKPVRKRGPVQSQVSKV